MKLINTIINNDLCISCGACVYACPHSNLSIILNTTKGQYEPKEINKNICQECKKQDCLEVCPSYKVDYEKLSRYVFKEKQNTENLGVVKQVFLGQSTDSAQNLKASSGGIIKEIIKHCLTEGNCGAFIALNHIEGLNFKPQLGKNTTDIERLPGSIYHNVDFSQTIKILENTKEKVILVGLPCQLEGIWMYIKKKSPSLQKKIYLSIGLMCGWSFSHHSIRALCTYRQIPYEEIQNIQYRGEGAIGKLKIITKNNKIITISRRTDLFYQSAFERSYNLKRCFYCINHSNLLADIVIGDAWLPSTVFTKTGISLIITRKSLSQKIVLQMKKNGLLRITPVTNAEIIESQKENVVHDNFSIPYREYIDSIGEYTPTFKKPLSKSFRPIEKKHLKKFHKILEKKIQLQRKNRYWTLFYIKYTKELHKFIMKYINWFLIRKIKIKSILGIRKEIPSEKLNNFI